MLLFYLLCPAMLIHLERSSLTLKKIQKAATILLNCAKNMSVWILIHPSRFHQRSRKKIVNCTYLVLKICTHQAFWKYSDLNKKAKFIYFVRNDKLFQASYIKRFYLDESVEKSSKYRKSFIPQLV